MYICNMKSVYPILICIMCLMTIAHAVIPHHHHKERIYLLLGDSHEESSDQTGSSHHSCHHNNTLQVCAVQDIQNDNRPSLIVPISVITPLLHVWTYLDTESLQVQRVSWVSSLPLPPTLFHQGLRAPPVL